MQNTTALYKELIQQSGRLFRAQINVTFSDSTTAVLTDDNIMQDSLVITTGTTDEGSFSIGNAVIGQLEFDIDNSSGQYDNMSFDDADFDVRIGLIVQQRYDAMLTPEWIRKGVFTSEEVTVNENYIHIVAYDNLSKLDRPFSEANITLPVTIATLYQSICTACGVVYDSGSFDNDDLVIPQAADIDGDTSCRDVLSYAAQLCCRYIYADVYGTVRFGWYTDTTYAVAEQQRINGTVTITGVQLTDTSENVTLLGTTNYCLNISDDPLAVSAEALSASVWQDEIIGMELTPFAADIISDPSLEAGDIITVSDKHGNTYRTPVTNMVYRLDGKMTVSCDAETIKEKQRTACSVSARIVAHTDRRTAKKISEYDIRAKQFSQMMANAMGFFQTDVPQSDGSIISYLHDKPLLADSQIIWKKSISGFAVSRDGGQTYTAGFDSDGNAVFNILAAVGIVAEWLKVGSSVAGWVIQSGYLESADGSIKINSNTNTVDIYDNGQLLLRLSRSGIAVWDVVNDTPVEVGKVGLVRDGTSGDPGLSIDIKDGNFIDFAAWNSIVNQYRTKFRYTVGVGLKIWDNLLIATMAGSSTVNGITINGRDVTPHQKTLADGSTISYWGWDPNAT